LRAARKLAPEAVDWLELRVDHFATAPESLLATAPMLPASCIVTVRDPAEGGQNRLSRARRTELYLQFLPHAAAIDIELRNVRALSPALGAARQQGVKVIVSCHDFTATPSAARLQEILRRAADAGADIIKIAARADTVAALHRLLALLAGKTPRPLSVMAMGRYGKVSRLLFAQAGSVLNYAYLGTANASGQWSVRDFRARLAELEN
jgi:3-dehydroquinate dehydratase-1